jgi:type IV secretory pathway VirB2 component (pilin)
MDLFDWILTNRAGIVLLGQIALCLAVLAIVACWTFGWGRFRRDASANRPKSENLRYLITAALTKIINDFRHLLALILVVIFGCALVYTLVQAGSDMAQIKEALQAVTSTLGGLVGSIIGYYFGESKGRASNADGGAEGPVEVPPDNPASSRASADITPARRPEPNP